VASRRSEKPDEDVDRCGVGGVLADEFKGNLGASSCLLVDEIAKVRSGLLALEITRRRMG